MNILPAVRLLLCIAVGLVARHGTVLGLLVQTPN